MAGLKLTKKKIRGVRGLLVVAPEGDLVAATCSTLEAFINREMRAGANRIAVDLSQVKYMSSAAMGLLIEYVERARDGTGWFGLAAACEVVRSAIDVLGLGEYFRLSPTVESLLDRCGVPRQKRRAPAKPKRKPRSKK